MLSCPCWRRGRTVWCDDAGRLRRRQRIGAFIADQGAEQCGFCNPGFIMNALALFREKEFGGGWKSANIWQETCAAVPVMKDSFAAFWHFRLEERKTEGGGRMRVVNTSVRKRCDAAGNRTAGLRDDLAPQDCLIVKLLRSRQRECDGKRSTPRSQ